MRYGGKRERDSKAMISRKKAGRSRWTLGEKSAWKSDDSHGSSDMGGATNSILSRLNLRKDSEQSTGVRACDDVRSQQQVAPLKETETPIWKKARLVSQKQPQPAEIHRLLAERETGEVNVRGYYLPQITAVR